jgi:hypothetical protein
VSPVTKHDDPSPKPARDSDGIGPHARAWRICQRLSFENPDIGFAV